MIQEHDLLAGKYRIERLLALGGMGSVFEAVHQNLGQSVAVKVLAPELCEDASAVERFLREARAAVRLQGEHVTRVLDVGTSDAGEPYIIMEFLCGRDLARELEQGGRLRVQAVVDYVLQACEAVAEAHSLGIIHRDLKPANLFLSRRPDGSPLVKVLDFGISKAVSMVAGTTQLPPSITASQSLVGSPAYMSPEQVRKPKLVDARTDIWSLGVILYELLVGEAPFSGDNPISALAAVVSDPVPSISEKRQDVLPGLEAIIMKCLEKTPQRRFQSVAELAEALRPYASAESLPSIVRVSGILRSWSVASASTTLCSVGLGAPVEADAQVANVDVMSAPSARPRETPTEQTPTGWAGLQTASARKRRVALVLGSTASVLALASLWLLGWAAPTSARFPSRSPGHPGLVSTPPHASTKATPAPAGAASPTRPAAKDESPAPALAARDSAFSAPASQAPVRPKARPRSGVVPVTPRTSTTPGVKPEPLAMPDPLEGRR